MTNDAVKKRNELAANYLPDHEPFSDRHFKAGFDAGYQVAMDEANQRNEITKSELNLAKVQIGVLNHIRDTYEKESLILNQRIQKLREALELSEKELFRFNKEAPLTVSMVSKPVYLTARDALKADEEAQK